MAVKAEKSLFVQAGDFWNKHVKLDKEGLVLLDKTIQRVVEYRDWDALSRFISRAGMDKPKVARIVRAAFGDSLTYKTDTSHSSGGVIKMKWPADQKFVLLNSYAHVMKAVAEGKAFNDAGLQKAIKPIKKEPNKDKAELLAAYKTRAEKWAKENGITIGAMIAALQAKPTNEAGSNGIVVHKAA